MLRTTWSSFTSTASTRFLPRSSMGAPLLLGLVDAFHQELLEIGLLEIDEGRERVPLLGQEVELEDLAVLVKHLAQAPDHTLVEHRLGTAIAVGDLESAFGKADGPAARADAGVIIEHDHRHAAQAEIEGHCQPDGSAAHDHHRVTYGIGRVLIGRTLVGIELEGQAVAIPGPLAWTFLPVFRPPAVRPFRGYCQPCNCRHICSSRAAVQIRGVSIPRASS